MNTFYREVGLIDIVSKAEVIHLWDEDAVDYEPCSKYWVTVMRRKDAN